MLAYRPPGVCQRREACPPHRGTLWVVGGIVILRFHAGNGGAACLPRVGWEGSTQETSARSEAASRVPGSMGTMPLLVTNRPTRPRLSAFA